MKQSVTHTAMGIVPAALLYSVELKDGIMCSKKVTFYNRDGFISFHYDYSYKTKPYYCHSFNVA